MRLAIIILIIFLVGCTTVNEPLNEENSSDTPIVKGIPIDPNDLKNPPTASDPLTFKSQVKIQKSTELEVGFFNRLDIFAKSATIGISQCLDAEGENKIMQDKISKHIVVYSQSSDISPQSGAGYKVKLRLVDEGLAPNLYVCKMVVYDKDTAGGVEGINFQEPASKDSHLYYEKEFFLEVVE